MVEDSGDAGASIPLDVIAFGVLDTMFSTASLGPLLTAAGGDAATLGLWLARVMADGFALAAAGDYRSLREVAKASLHEILPHATAAARERVLAHLSALEPYADAAPAMGRAVLGARVIVVTNVGRDLTRKLLAHAKLDTFVDTIVSASDMRSWKPRPDIYAAAATSVGEPAGRVALVTSHPWDVHGAHRAGLITVWCNRRGDPYPATFTAPDLTAVNLLDAVEALFGPPI